MAQPPKTDLSELTARVVAASLPDFDLLVEDLDATLPGKWSALPLDTAGDMLAALTPDQIDLVVIAVAQEDEGNLDQIVALITRLKTQGHTVLLILDEVGTRATHQLVRAGADDFTPYPMAEGAFAETVTDLLARLRATALRAEAPAAPAASGRARKDGVIMPVYGVAGGVGTTTFAVNLAHELQLATAKEGGTVALLDLDLQYGTASTYLELQRREAVYEFLSSPDTLDDASLEQAMQMVGETLHVLTAPPETLPYEFLERESLDKLLKITAGAHDFVVIDMPTALTPWSDIVLQSAETYFAVMELDMRSADNMLRFLRALKAEELPFEKIQFVVNRGPGFGEGGKRSRLRKLSETLGIEFNLILPDGGKTVADASDHGRPLASAASRNTLRKEIRKTATSLVDLVKTRKEGAV